MLKNFLKKSLKHILNLQQDDNQKTIKIINYLNIHIILILIYLIIKV
jgi:hypothetical protein